MPVIQVIKCWQCGTLNRTQVPDSVSAVLRCARCKIIIVEQHVVSGYVYVFKKESMPGILKIGMTTRTVEERIGELNGTNVPTPFQLVLKMWSQQPDIDEALVHERLQEYRVSTSREFFRCEEDVALRVMKEVMNEIGRYFEPELGA